MENNALFDNYVNQFKEWLKNEKNYKDSAISSRLSNIRTIGKYYDILKEFSIDECEGVLDELKFSSADNEPRTSMVIRGNYYNGLATYRQTLRLFINFLKYVGYTAPVLSVTSRAKFVGSFDEFKRYVGPKCRNEVNIFCKSERIKHNGICEYCGQKHVLQSAHIEERPVIIKNVLDRYYCKGVDFYEVDLEDFFSKFKEAHMPIPDHIFFLCKECHDKLDNKHTISVDDIKNKRSK